MDVQETSEIIEDPSRDLFYVDPKKWLEGLRYFIYNKILPKCFSPDDENYKVNSEKMVNSIAMGLWKIAFTHKTFDPNGVNNYETLEHMGDTAMKTAFDSSVIQKYPGISEYIITLINNIYVSKPIQKQKSEELGLYKWIRIIIPANIHIHEDLLEALFGALYKIGDQVLGKGNGYVLSSNLAANIYDIESIDINAALAHPKSVIKEIFEKMHWNEGKTKISDEIETITNKDGVWEIELRLPKKALEYVKNKSLPTYPDGLFARAVGVDKKVTMDTVYGQGVEYLKQYYDITREWAFEESNKEMINTLTTQAREKIVEGGYVRLDYLEYRVGAKKYVQFVGEKENGHKTILMTVSSDKSYKTKDLIRFISNTYGEYGELPIQNIVEYKE